MTDEMKKKFTLRITGANKTALITILYEMLEIYVTDAETAVLNGDLPDLRKQTDYARGCMNELMNSLNFEYSVSGAFMQLYLYMNRELIRARVRKSTEPLDHVLLVTKKLKDAYQILEKQDTSEPLMLNTEKVYAGITYDRTDVAESIAGTGTLNRGYLV